VRATGTVRVFQDIEITSVTSVTMLIKKLRNMTIEIYIDDEKETLIVGKPDFEYEVVHTEFDTQFDKKKIWVRRK